jgi:hypothetical protein
MHLEHEELAPGTHRYRGEMTFSAAIAALREDPLARRTLSDTLAASPFPAFFWETPPTPPDRPFEFVLQDSPALAEITADHEAFADEFGLGLTSTFANLRGDAILVVPRKMGVRANYAHLASFCRTAPPEQHDALWTAVATAIRAWSRPGRLWVSTSGLGVSWLHVRLDTVPKYYSYAPYRV